MIEIKLDRHDPLVSVIVPAYNAEKFIAGTLDSLVKQAFRDIEIIVVNDGSTDKTADIIKHFSFDRRLRYVTKDNGGTGSALNTGHHLARGKYLTWCSADNIYFLNFVSELVNALRHCEEQKAPVSFVYSDFVYIDANGNRIQNLIHNNPQPRHDLINGYDLGMSFMYTRELWEKVGDYWSGICEDYDWAVRAAEHTEFGLVRAMLAAFRVHGGQITGNRKQEEAAAAEACRGRARQMLSEGKFAPFVPVATFKPVLVED